MIGHLWVLFGLFILDSDQFLNNIIQTVIINFIVWVLMKKYTNTQIMLLDNICFSMLIIPYGWKVLTLVQHTMLDVDKYPKNNMLCYICAFILLSNHINE
jgi:hypothetical protein